jgi:hypothetical protein
LFQRPLIHFGFQEAQAESSVRILVGGVVGHLNPYLDVGDLVLSEPQADLVVFGSVALGAGAIAAVAYRLNGSRRLARSFIAGAVNPSACRMGKMPSGISPLLGNSHGVWCVTLDV